MSAADFAAHRWLATFLRRHELQQPDGRPLHRYTFDDQEGAELSSLLSSGLRREPDCNGRYLAGGLCLYVAQWFQKNGGRGSWAWDRPLGAIGVTLDQPTRAGLAEQGLAFWRRPLRRRDDGARLFLSSLIVEGGLPRQALKGSSWLDRYLGRVIADLEGTNPLDLEAATRHARFHLRCVPDSFADEGLADIIGETAKTVVELRRKASGRPAGLDPVSWLDSTETDWRSLFPIQLEDTTVAALVEGLIRLPVVSIAGKPLIERIARVKGTDIEFGMRFAETALAEVVRLESWHTQMNDALRARLVPEGRFADAIERVPAVLEKLSSERSDEWLFRCVLPQQRRTAWGIDLKTEARATVIHQSRACGSCILPGGESIDSDLVVFRLEVDACSIDAPSLVLLGTGSIRTTMAAVAVLVPTNWPRTVSLGTSLEVIGRQGDNELNKLAGTAVFEAPDGSRYKIHTGANDDRAVRYFVVGRVIDQLDSHYPVISGEPAIWCRSADGIAERVPEKRIEVRHVDRGSQWLPFTAHKVPFGSLQARIADDGEFSYLRFAHVPPLASIEQRPSGNGKTTIEFIGFEQVSLDVRDIVGCKLDSEAGNSGRAEVSAAADTGTVAPRFGVELRWPAGGSIRANVLAMLRQAAFYRTDGTPIRQRAMLTVSDLRGGFAASTGQGHLSAELVEPGRPTSAYLQWGLDGRKPLAPLLPEIERLFAMTDDLDARVRLSCQAGGSETTIEVRRYDCLLKPGPEGVRLNSTSQATLPPDLTIDIVGKPVALASGPEHVLGVISAAAAAPVHVPEGQGCWLVYGRHNGRLRARPALVVRGSSQTGEQSTSLQQIMAIETHPERTDALSTAMSTAACSERPDILNEILNLLKAVSGDLPLQAFDAIRLLPRCPDAALRLLASVKAEDLDTLLGIESELPLSWPWLPLEQWCRAFELEWKVLHGQLAAHGLQHVADSAILARLDAITLHDPRLAPHVAIVCKSMGFDAGAKDIRVCKRLAELRVPHATLAEVAERAARQLAGECFKRNDGRKWPGRPSFREKLQDLPSFIGTFMGYAHSVLDAPYVAARLAVSRLPWTQDIERMLRMNRAFDSAYFDDVLAMQLIVEWSRR